MTADLLAGARWRCAAVAADSAMPEVDGVRWYPATVPGTAAAAVREAEGTAAALARDYDAEDWWFRTTIGQPTAGPWLLTMHGLATVADIWVDGSQVARSESMFLRVQASIDTLWAGSTIAIRFAALAPLLARRWPRGGWRSSLVSQQGLRWWRTSLLGRAPLFTGTAAPVGPWRAIELVPQQAIRVVSKSVATSVDGTCGVLGVHGCLRLPPGAPLVAQVSLGEVTKKVRLTRTEQDVTLQAELVIEDVALWWPHTHGRQPLYPLTVSVAGQVMDWGKVGFRTLYVDRTGGAFALSVNGVRVFCRGACWTTVDPVGLTPQPEQVRATLLRAREAGLNMVRITGTTVYEDELFWKLCAELGLLVWQDAMLATLDPPEQEHFTTLLTAEIEQVCVSLQGNPALAVFSGGSETEQQPTLLGLAAPQRTVRAVQQIIPSVVDRVLPGVPYVSSSPSGGALPTHVGTGVAHYFGVGAYLRPLSDVRASRIRFAAECLAFATPPERAVVEDAFGSAAVAGHDPRWKAAVPRDRGASWDFEDVRDHYVRTLFEVDPLQVRRCDPERYLDLGRAAVCEAMGQTFAYWRRAGSRCDGALVLSLRDLEPGAGWGLLDAAGNPKPPWYVLRRLCQPVAVLVTDDGLDGLRIDLLNDRAHRLRGRLQVQAHTRAGATTALAALSVQLEAHSGQSWLVDELAGRFLDLNHAYKFGPQAYDVLTVQLCGEDGAEVCRAVSLLGGAASLPLESALGLQATAALRPDGCWSLSLSTQQAAQYISIAVPGYLPDDSWFHLEPGGRQTVNLRTVERATVPRGYVRALNCTVDVPVEIGR